MGVSKKATVKGSEVELVFAGDPDVEAPEGLRGWVKTSTPGVGVKKGADVVKVRGLNFDEDLDVADAGVDGSGKLRWYAKNARRCELGIVSVNGKKKRKFVRSWIENCDDKGIWVLLALYIAALTNGDDPDTVQRDAITVEGDEDDEDEDDE